MKTDFYNIEIDLMGQNEALLCVKDVLLHNTRRTLFFLNAHCYNLAQKNATYMNALRSSDYLLNDGIGISIGGRLKGIKFPDNLNGTDFIPQIINEGYNSGKTFYLLGTKDHILEKAKANLEEKFPGIMIVGMHHGFFSEKDSKSIIHEINRLKADIVIVGMGVPQQEIWIHENRNEMPEVKLFIAGGAILDFLSGTISRAPLWMRRLKMEWVYRLCLEPKRMWKRYIVGNILFFYNIFKNTRQSKRKK